MWQSPNRKNKNEKLHIPLWCNIDNQEDLPLVLAEINIVSLSILQASKRTRMNERNIIMCLRKQIDVTDLKDNNLYKESNLEVLIRTLRFLP